MTPPRLPGTWPTALLITSLLSPQSPAASLERFAVFPAQPGEIVVTHQGQDYLRFRVVAWGPQWTWTGLAGSAHTEASTAVATLQAKIADVPLSLNLRAAPTAPQSFRIDYELQAASPTDLTLLVAELSPGPAFRGRPVAVESASQTATVEFPFGKRLLGQAVTALAFTDRTGRTARLRFDPPCEIQTDDHARLVLAKDHLAADTPRRLVVNLELPAAADWFPSLDSIPQEPGADQWYPWQAKGNLADSALSMADWIERPAGRHGRIRREGDRLLYHGRPMKLWGLNLCYATCAPDPELADRRAAFYPHYGINAVRLHKFADGPGWDGIQAKDSAAEYDPAGLKRLDYQVAKFKEAGLFIKLSAHFGTIKLGPADRHEVRFLDEFGRLTGDRPRVAVPHSAYFYSPEIQRVHLRQTLNLLQHRNPHTDLTYAQDPAIFALEIINEQSVFFYTSMEPLKKSPTLRRQVAERFSAWLANRYQSHQGLLQAWGHRALDGFEKDGFPPGEHLDQRNLLPLGNPWYWDPAQLHGSQSFRRQRLLDTLQFLYELQNEAYDRYVAAVRATGFEGEILGSNWQAGRAYSHYANLHTDHRIGLIDRHNYFGGSERGGNPSNLSMLARAGSGCLSSGLQQTADRPFMLSEWIHVFPNEWGVEGPALIGAYGLGLQGWDVSFLFQNGDEARFSTQLGRQPWDVMTPPILGVFPAVARQVLRGDVAESDLLAPRHVHLPSLFQGRLGFEDQLSQNHDQKELDSRETPARALAAVRCAVQFTDEWKETTPFDLQPFLRDGWIESSTRQLRWKEGTPDQPSGCFTLDTPATKAFVGFAPNQPFGLGPVTLHPQSRFAALYLTSPEPNGSLDTSPRLLLIAFARARNSEMKFSPTGQELLQRGRSPVLLEPVQAHLTLSHRAIASVRLLDHDGRRTDRFRPATTHAFSIDGATDQTPYYEITLAAEKPDTKAGKSAPP